jgi:anti-repressor protein
MLEKQFQAHKVRIIEENGEPLFVAADVGHVLNIAQVNSTIRDYDSDEKGVHTMHTLGGLQQVSVLTEAGLYRLIMQSRSENAKEFRRWVTHEILPTIRKTGKYETAPPADDIAHLIASTKSLIEKIEADRPKVEVYDRLIESRGLITIATAAKELGTGQKRLYADLRTQGILTRDNVPYQRYIEQGYFECKTTLINIGHGKTKQHVQPFVTAKGIAWLGSRK